MAFVSAGSSTDLGTDPSVRLALGDVVSLLVFDTFPAQCQIESCPFRYIDLHLGLLFLHLKFEPSLYLNKIEHFSKVSTSDLRVEKHLNWYFES